MRKSCMRTDNELIEEVSNEYYGETREIVKDAITKAYQLKNKEFVKTHKQISEIEDFKTYHRHMIQLRPDILMLIHLFKRSSDDEFESIWLDDNEQYYIEDYECLKESARQLLLQLEGNYCDVFIEALRDECDKILEDSNKRKAELLKNDIN